MAHKAAMREGENGLERQCSSCEVWLPATLEYFYSHQGGLTGRCKNCIKEASAEWQRNNPEKANAKNRKWTKENPEKVRSKSTKRARANPERHRLTSQKWRGENPERVRAIVMKWVRANPQKAQANGKKWRKENPEKAKAGIRKWRQENPEKAKAAEEKWRQENPEKVRLIRKYGRRKRRALKAGVEGFHTQSHEDALFEMQGGLCCWCSEVLNERTIDHIVPLVHKGSDYVDNLVICCKSCNSSKKDKVVFQQWQPRKMLGNMLEHVLNALKTEN